MTTETPKRETKKAAAQREQQEALDRLRAWIKPGDTIYTVLRHVSKSGMFRRISLKHFGPKPGEIYELDYNAALVMGIKLNREKEGIPVGGCGMDMGFHLVYNLSYKLYPDGFTCTGENKELREYCPSCDHSNGDRNYKPHLHKDGGYAIRHRWL